jgi:hypothetical protein
MGMEFTRSRDADDRALCPIFGALLGGNLGNLDGTSAVGINGTGTGRLADFLGLGGTKPLKALWRKK